MRRPRRILQALLLLPLVTERAVVLPSDNPLSVREVSPEESFLSVLPWQHDFGSVRLGERGDTLGIVLRNTGADPVVVTEIELPADTAFAAIQVPSTPLTLLANESVLLGVCLAPERRDRFRDSLVVLSSDGARPRQAVSLRGSSYTMFPARAGEVYGLFDTHLRILDVVSGASTPIGGWSGVSLRDIAIQPVTNVIHGVSQRALYRICRENFDLVYTLQLPVEAVALAFQGRDTLFLSSSEGGLYRADLRAGILAPVARLANMQLFSSLAVHPVTSEVWCSVRGQTVGAPVDKIMKVNNTTGDTILVGYAGGGIVIQSLVFGSDRLLYALGTIDAKSSLLTIDTADGEGTKIVKLLDSSPSALAMRPDSTKLLSVDDGDGVAPAGYVLYQNYPNPFNPITTIEFALPHSSAVSLRVFNVLGEEVLTLVDAERAAGVHCSVWDASGMGSGVYLYRLSAGNFIQVRRMALVK